MDFLAQLVNDTILHGTGQSFDWDNYCSHDELLDDDLFIDEDAPFYKALPHRTRNLSEAREDYGAPYLPDEESLRAVEEFWAKDERKRRLLTHLGGNVAVRDFITGAIDARTLVGLLRSQASEFGYGTLRRLAALAAKAATDTTTKSFRVDREAQLLSLRCEDAGGPRSASTILQRPDSLHPAADVSCSILKKMYDPRATCVTYDWSEIAGITDVTGARNVATLTNLICAIVMPAYSIQELLALGDSEKAVLKSCDTAATADAKDRMDEMAVLACINSMVQNFTGPSETSFVNNKENNKNMHLVCAPMRLPVFDEHPVVNVRNSPFFFPTEDPPVVASLSTASQSTLSIKQRETRNKKKLLFGEEGGVVAHVLPAVTNRTQHRHTPRSAEAAAAHIKRQDPFLQISQKERTWLLRSILSLSGSYGWFGLLTGNVQGPDVLFADTPADGIFPPNIIRKYASGVCYDDANTVANPLRNRQIDLRFDGIELAETVGNESCFRIRPASLCNNMETTSAAPKADKPWTGNVVEGTKNPFYTRSGTPCWYNPGAMSAVFGHVEFKDHVKACDNSVHVFEPLVEQSRWEANQRDKVRVLDDMIFGIRLRTTFLQTRMETEFGHTIPKCRLGTDVALSNSSVSRRREVCRVTEKVVAESMPFLDEMNGGGKKRRRVKPAQLSQLETDLAESVDALSVCFMMRDSCDNHKERFIEGECRAVAHDLTRHLYRASAKNHIKNTLIRGVKWSVTWQRPYDEYATSVLKNVPRCRLPQIMSSISGLMLLKTRDTTPRSMRHALLSAFYGEQVAGIISGVNCLEWINWCVKVYGLAPLENNNNSFNTNPAKTAAMRTTKKRLRAERGAQPDEETIMKMLDRKYGPYCYGPCKKEANETAAHVQKRKSGRVGHLDLYTIAMSCFNDNSRSVRYVGAQLKLYPVPEF